MVQEGFIFQWKGSLLFYLPGKMEEMCRLFSNLCWWTECSDDLWDSVLFHPF